MQQVLVIDDNALDRKVLRDALAHAGYAIEDASDGASGLRRLYELRPDAVVLDVVMPEMDGWTVCSRIRELSDVPIIMLTSLNSEDEMVRGLDLGADDFVSKPVSPRQLLARLRAVLRRRQASQRPADDLVYDDGDLRIDGARYEVHRDGQQVDLTPTEMRLLLALARAPERVHTYGELLSSVWGPEYVDDIDFLRVYLWRLRKKLEPDPAHPRWLLTERGFGYRFNARRPERGGDSR